MPASGRSDASDDAGSRRGIRVGVTGHRQPPKLPVESLAAVHTTVGTLLDRIGALADGAEPDACRMTIISSLAAGADQIVAEEGLARGAALEAVLPFPATEYRRDFDGAEARRRFDVLLRSARRGIDLGFGRATEAEAYEAAGLAMLAESDILIAIWDEAQADGRGGTAHIVAEALATGVPVLLINPATPERAELIGPGAPTARQPAEHALPGVVAAVLGRSSAP